MFNLLIVDDDDHVLKSLARLLRSREYSIDCCGGPQEALIQCALQEYDLIISDQRMPDMEGTELFAQIASSFPHTRRILISGYSDFSSVTDAFNDGILHKFVIKPWDNNDLKMLVAEQLKLKQLGVEEELPQSVNLTEKGEVIALLGEEPTENFHGIITADAEMLRQLDIIQKTANSNAPFFIHGETGTGKELIARAIHLESRRAEESFVALNCANLTESLLESQLFGHIKGAFTGADKYQKGLLEEAEGGSLFLDEVTEIPLALQAKLLRVLQEREFSPVGQTRPVPFDVQIISASSSSLETAVKNNQFREDLRYRLEVIPITLPSLRLRKVDIRILFDYYLATEFKRQKREFLKVEQEVYDCVEHYAWPGNVRELVNVCTYVAALSGQELSAITIDKLPPAIRSIDILPRLSESPVQPPTKRLKTVDGVPAVTRDNLQEASEMYSGNREAMASHFGISRMTLWRRIKKYESEE